MEFKPVCLNLTEEQEERILAAHRVQKTVLLFCPFCPAMTAISAARAREHFEFEDSPTRAKDGDTIVRTCLSCVALGKEAVSDLVRIVEEAEEEVGL